MAFILWFVAYILIAIKLLLLDTNIITTVSGGCDKMYWKDYSYYI